MSEAIIDPKLRSLSQCRNRGPPHGSCRRLAYAPLSASLPGWRGAREPAIARGGLRGGGSPSAAPPPAFSLRLPSGLRSPTCVLPSLHGAAFAPWVVVWCQAGYRRLYEALCGASFQKRDLGRMLARRELYSRPASIGRSSHATRVRCPVLLVMAKRDEVIPPSSVKKEQARLPDGATCCAQLLPFRSLQRPVLRRGRRDRAKLPRDASAEQMMSASGHKRTS